MEDLLRIETSSYCLLCLEDLSGDDGEPEPMQSVPYRLLLRFLNIRIFELCQIQLPREKMKQLENLPLEVSLCQRCSDGLDQFSHWYRKWEMIRFQLEVCVKSIYSFMEEGSKKEQGFTKSSFANNVKSKSGYFIANGARTLRDETKRKCGFKVDMFMPRVEVKNLRPEVVSEANGQTTQSDFCPEQESKNDTEEDSTDKKTFQCPNCLDTFTSEENLTTHMTIHFGKNRCIFCGGVYAGNSQQLIKHMLTQHRDKMYRLILPKAVTEQELRYVINCVKAKSRVLDNKRFGCFSCEKTFHKQCLLEMHVLTTHKKDIVSIFNKKEWIKLKVTEKIEDLSNDSDSDEDDIVIVADIGADDSSGGEKVLTNKKQNDFVPNVKVHREEDIDAQRQDSRNGTNNTNIAYKCFKCQRNFNSTISLQRHLIAIHKEFKQKSMETTAVDKLVKNSAGPSSIVKVIGSKTVKTFKCSMCNKTFHHLNSLKNHMTTHGDKVVCEFCDKTFTRSNHLDSHVIKFHQEDLYKSFLPTSVTHPDLLKTIECVRLKAASTAKGYECFCCDEKIVEWSIMELHIVKTHPEAVGNIYYTKEWENTSGWDADLDMEMGEEIPVETVDLISSDEDNHDDDRSESELSDNHQHLYPPTPSGEANESDRERDNEPEVTFEVFDMGEFFGGLWN